MKTPNPLPPLETQQQIIDIMDNAYQIKKQKETEAQRLLDSIDDFVLSELGIELPEFEHKMCFSVQAEEVKGGRYDPLFYTQSILKQIESSKYGASKLEGFVEYLKSGFAAGKQKRANEVPELETVPQIRPTNISNERRLVFEKTIYIDASTVNEDDMVFRGEVLFNNTNSQELVGKTVLFDLDGQYCCSNHITRIKVLNDCYNDSFLTILLNLYQRKKVFGLCTNWNNQSGVNAELLKSISIPSPPIEIQHKIATEVQARIDKSEVLKQQAKEALETAKAQVEKIILGEKI